MIKHRTTLEQIRRSLVNHETQGMAAAQLLQAQYPDWLSQADLSIRNGWAEIVVTLFDELAAALPAGASFRAVQIKEKFARLCVYWTSDGVTVPGTTEHTIIQTILAAAGERAAETRQRCGPRGAFRNIGSWCAVLRDDDAATRARRYDEP